MDSFVNVKSEERPMLSVRALWDGQLSPDVEAVWANAKKQLAKEREAEKERNQVNDE